MSTKKNPEHRAILSEVRTLEKNRRKVVNDLKTEIRRVERVRAALRVAKRHSHAVLTRIDKRRKILNGRLAA